MSPVLTQYSNSVINAAKTAAQAISTPRSETCLEFTREQYPGFTQTFTTHLVLAKDFRTVSSSTELPSPGCLLITRLDDEPERSQDGYVNQVHIVARSTTNQPEIVGEIHWGLVTYPGFPPYFNPSPYHAMSGPTGGVRGFNRTTQYFVASSIYPGGIKTYAKLDYLLAAEFARIMGRTIGPYQSFKLAISLPARRPLAPQILLLQNPIEVCPIRQRTNPQLLRVRPCAKRPRIHRLIVASFRIRTAFPCAVNISYPYRPSSSLTLSFVTQ